MWNRIFDRMVRRIIRHGTLELTTPDGRTAIYGDGTGAPVRARITDPAVPRHMVRNAELALGEAYTNGTFVIEDDDLHGFLTLAMNNFRTADGSRWQGPLSTRDAIARRFTQWNEAARSKRNVAAHYDLSGELYDLFLDTDRQYSCAYFREGDETLDEAQIAKKAHIASKLRLEPGQRVLDIGCGWGGMALTLAQDYGVSVVGITLSEEQHKVATARARAAGLADRVEFRLMDYRALDETFDRIVSVGMFEHVGVPQYRTYFAQVNRLLAEDGVALVHTIGRKGPPGRTSDWITKYIFPGGYVPAMSEMMAAVELSDLWSTDVEVWRLHYAQTLRHWHDRFMANIDKARALYDDRFCRMWRYYLVASELTFRYGGQCVFQVQLARRQDAVPLTRDYMAEEERTALLRAAE